MLEKDPGFNWFLWLISISCLTVILGAFYFFYYQKNYDFIVEVECDPTTEECVEISCEGEEECPESGLVYFKRYALNANDFSKCENEDCTEACETGMVKCELIKCEVDEIAEEYCSTPQTPIETE